MTQPQSVQHNQPLPPSDFQLPQENQVSRRLRLSPLHWVLFTVVALALLFIAFISFSRSVNVDVLTTDLLNPDKLVPVTAQVEFESALKLPIGNRVMLLPGTHVVSVTAQGFHSAQQALAVGAVRYPQFEIRLIRLPGQLAVTLVPDIPAQLFLNGKAFAELPGRVDNIPAGQHEITVDAPLYRAETREILVEGMGRTQELAVALQPAWANVSFESTPVGAEVLIDDVVRGKTPLAIQLEEGLHNLRVTADKFQTVEREITITAQEDLIIPPINLLPADGEITVTTEPEAAAVIVDGEYRGVSPLTLALRPDRDTQLKLYKGGYRLDARSVNLAAAERRDERVTLQPDLVNVEFSVRPPDAQIYIDGVLRGEGSRQIALSTLPHEIRISKPGYVSYTNRIIPSKTTKQLVSAQLLTKDQYYWANIPDTYQTQAGQTMLLFKAPGKVSMGSSRREAGRRSNEVSYTATLNKHFYVSQHEVTNKQFRAFQPTHSAGNYKKKSLDSNKHPAVNISWQQAARYCNWLSLQEGLTPFYETKAGYIAGHRAQANGYRLLSEVEWAWLARNQGDSVLLYPWGQNASPPQGAPIGNFADVNAADLLAFTLPDYDDGYAASAPVGRYPVNHRGLFDMAGNAAEWVHDWYSAKGNLEAGRGAALVDPLGPEIGEFHVVRGSSWARGHLPQLRLAYRDFGAKGKHDIGFRIARYAGPKQ